MIIRDYLKVKRKEISNKCNSFISKKYKTLGEHNKAYCGNINETFDIDEYLVK